MLIFAFLKWWYSRGFRSYLEKFIDALKNAADFFSIRLLVRNFFSPFRQISAEGTSSLALDARLHAFFDFLISCLIGATIRFFILIIGLVVICAQFALGLVGAVAWPLAPVAIFYCCVLYGKGIVF